MLIVTKYRFFGDTLLAVPTIRAVAELWPGAQIALLGGSGACELLQNCPYLSEFIEYNPYRQEDRGILRYAQLIGQLRQKKFDVALLLNRTLHSAMTSFLGGAKIRAGWSGFEGSSIFLNRRCDYKLDDPEVECLLDVLNQVTGVVEDGGEPELWLTNAERESARQSMPSGGRLIGIQPGASHDYKRWPIGSFADLCERLLSQDHRCQIVLLGGPEEADIACDLLSILPGHLKTRIHNCVGLLSLRRSLGALTVLDLFIGADTAVRHAAQTFDTPSIALFGPTNAKKWGNERLPRHRVMVSPNGKMDGITVDQVMDNVELIERYGRVAEIRGA